MGAALIRRAQPAPARNAPGETNIRSSQTGLNTHDTAPSGARESSTSHKPRAAYTLRGFRVELLDLRVREREGERG